VISNAFFRAGILTIIIISNIKFLVFLEMRMRKSFMFDEKYVIIFTKYPKLIRIFKK